MSELHPIDFDSLRKDSSIEQRQIEEIFNVKAEDDPNGYRLSMMKLVELIERNRRDIYPRIHQNTIRLMNDREAEEYNILRHRHHVRSIARDALRRGRIDRADFSDAERRAAESRDLGYSAIAVMTSRALKKAECEAKLLGAGEELGDED